MIINPTVLRTKTCTSLLKILIKCKKYLVYKKDVNINIKEIDDLLYYIKKIEKLHKQEMTRVGYRKYDGEI
jgi:hypothetical protein